MDKISAPVKGRIIEFIEKQGITKKKFYEKLNVSATNFRGQSLKSEVSSEVIVKISSAYPEVNLVWLITGKGEMLKPDVVINGGTTIIGSDFDISGNQNKIIDQSKGAGNKLESLCRTQEIEIKHLTSENGLLKEQIAQLKELIELYKR